MLTGVTLIVVALTYFPALALGSARGGTALMTLTQVCHPAGRTDAGGARGPAPRAGRSA